MANETLDDNSRINNGSSLPNYDSENLIEITPATSNCGIERRENLNKVKNHVDGNDKTTQHAMDVMNMLNTNKMNIDSVTRDKNMVETITNNNSNQSIPINNDEQVLNANNLMNNKQIESLQQSSNLVDHGSELLSRSTNISKQITVSWRNLMYSIQRTTISPSNCFTLKKDHPIIKKDKRVILKGINGHFSTGNLTAVMGPSGSGKSTMLDCIVGFRKKGFSGDIKVNSSTGSNVKVALINQTDYLIESFTVREMLVYASRLKNYHKSDKEEIQLEEVIVVNIENNNNLNAIDASSKGNLLEDEKVKNYHHKLTLNIIHQLGLDVCIDTKAGSCSGGQKKRISIALEMISK